MATTKLTKSVTREIDATGCLTPLIVTLTVAGATIRCKGSRTSFLLPWGLAYQRAAQLAADERIRARRARRHTSRGLLATEASNR